MKIGTRLIVLTVIIFLSLAASAAMRASPVLQTALLSAAAIILIGLVILWIVIPLWTLEHTLREGKPDLLGTLPKKKNEIGTIAYLIRQFFTQQGLLIDEIASRKKAEEELRVSEERFMRAFRVNPCLMTITRPDTGEIIEANDAFLRTTGYRLAEVVGHTSLELHIMDAETRATLASLLRTEQAVRNLEIEIQARDGRRRLCLYSTERMDMRGEPVILSVAVDISARQEMEAALNRKVAELERFNRMAIGREAKMVQLKERIRELEERRANGP